MGRKFIGLPVEIEAIQYTGEISVSDMAAAWGPTFSRDASYDEVMGSLDIETREGVMRADRNDWIIRGTIGEFYPCKPEVFEKKYKAVEPDQSLDPLRELTLRVVFSRKSALDKVYANHLRGFHGALDDQGFHIRAIAEGDQMRRLEDEDDNEDDDV